MKALLTLCAVLVPSLLLAEEPFAELSFEAALEQAGTADQVVMIDFFTTWCGPCKKLDAVTWKDDEVRAWLEQHAVALKIDAEVQVDLARRFAVNAYPSMIFVRPDGTELGRIVGYKDPAGFLVAAGDVLTGARPSERIRAQLEEAGGNDPSLRQSLGRELANEQQHEEALEQYLWCFDHGVEHQPSYVGVRGSFLLSSIVRLGQSFPPALEALRERRDEAHERLSAGKGTAEDAGDFAALNKALDEPALTLQVYDQLATGDAVPAGGVDVRAMLFRHVFDRLLDAHRYADIVSAVEHPLPLVQRQISLFGFAKNRAEDDGLQEYMKMAAIDGGAKYYEAFAGTRQNDDQARAIVELLVEFDSSASTWDALILRAERAERQDLVDELTQHKAEAAETDG